MWGVKKGDHKLPMVIDGTSSLTESEKKGGRKPPITQRNLTEFEK